MSTNLKAALVLTLNDQLTAGLNKIKTLFGELGSLGKKLGLGKLETGASALERTSSAAQGLTGHLRGVAGAADRAYASLKRMGTAWASWGKRTFGPMSRTEAFTGAAEGFSVIEPIRSYAGFENIARHSAITEGLSGGALEAETKRLMTMFRKDALATSQSSESIAQAYQDLIQTGIAPKLAEKLLPIHSRAATAYNISPEALGHAVFALSDSFKIGEGDMGGALAAMAMASKEGRFKVEDFSHFLPGIGGNMAKLGMTGRGSANLVFAALETVMKNSADPGTGATNFSDFMNYLTSPMGARSFALDSKGMAPATKRVLAQNHITGIDMPQLLANARKAGIDPLTAVLGTLQKKLAGLPPDVVAEVLGAFFHDLGARNAALAMLQHPDEFLKMQKQLGQADSGMLDRDFTSANAAPKKKLDLLVEQLTQFTQMAGAAFLPILTAIVFGMREFGDVLDWIDAKMPGAKNGVLLAVGSFLALSAGVAGLRVAMPVLSGAFSILGGVLRLALAPVGLLWRGLTFIVGAIEGIVPAIAAVAGVSAGVVAGILVAVAALVAAAYDIYAGWATFKGFFEDLWQGVVDVFEGATLFIIGVFLGRMDLASAGLRMIWHGIEEFFGGLWNAVMQLFVDFGTWVDGWTGGAMTKAVDAIKSAWGELKQWFADLWSDIRKPFDDFVNAIVNSPVGHLMGLSASPQLQPPGSGAGDGKAGTGAGMDPTGGSYLMPSLTGQITVGVDPNNGKINIQRAETSSPGFSILNMPVDPGLALGVP